MRIERQGGNGHGDVVRRLEGSFFEGCERRRGECFTARNAADLTTGSGMQQARDLRVEETIRVVRNHEDGTGFEERDLREPKRAAMRAGVDTRQGRWRGIWTKARGGGSSDRARTTGNTLWRGAKTRGSRTIPRLSREGNGAGVTQTEHLEDARGNA